MANFMALEEGNIELSSKNPSECPICFENLFTHPTGVLLDVTNTRTCKHYFHEECISRWIRQSNCCPICNRSCVDVKPIPNPLIHPQEWFNAVDLDGNGKLDKSEVLDVLEAQLPINVDLLRNNINDLWPTWDKDNDGLITMEELVSDEGLINYVTCVFPYQNDQVPDLRTNMRAWFEFWDKDQSGSLDKWEVVRALSKTFSSTNSGCSLDSLQSLRETVQEVWPIFDPNGDGTIDMAEFCCSHGLGESICASIITGQSS